MSVQYDSHYTSDLNPEPGQRESQSIWSETVATVLVVAVAVLFVSFLAVASGLN